MSPLSARLLWLNIISQRANKAEFDRLVLRAKGKPSLSDKAASSEPNPERDTILVTSDIEG